MDYPKTRKAASELSRDRKALAGALLAEIPSRKAGRPRADSDEQTIEAELERAAELLAQDGHEFAARTLGEYRKTAAWVANRRVNPPINWRDCSYTVHEIAYKGGMSLAQFDQWLAKSAKKGARPTVTTIRQELGINGEARTPLAERPTAREVVQQAPAEERAAIARELLRDDEEVRDTVFQDRSVRVKAGEAIEKHYARPESRPAVEPVETIELLVYARRLWRTIQDGLRLVMEGDVSTLTTEQREAVASQFERCHNAMHVLRESLEGHDLDSELAELLERGE